jgi:hypothetical protein
VTGIEDDFTPHPRHPKRAKRRKVVKDITAEIQGGDYQMTMPECHHDLCGDADGA